MSEHVELLIDAYLDGELTSQQERHIEDHLVNCAACQAYLMQRQKLASLLKEAPAADGLKPAALFAQEIVRSLDAVPQAQPPWLQELRNWLTDPRVVRLGWLAFPVGLLVASAYVQAVGILSAALTLIPGFEPLVAQVLSLAQPTVRVPLAQPWSSFLGSLSGFSLSDWSLLTGLVLSIAIGLLYLAWIAGWLSNNQEEQRAPANQ